MNSVPWSTRIIFGKPPARPTRSGTSTPCGAREPNLGTIAGACREKAWTMAGTRIVAPVASRPCTTSVARVPVTVPASRRFAFTRRFGILVRGCRPGSLQGRSTFPAFPPRPLQWPLGRSARSTAQLRRMQAFRVARTSPTSRRRGRISEGIRPAWRFRQSWNTASPMPLCAATDPRDQPLDASPPADLADRRGLFRLRGVPHRSCAMGSG